MTRKIVGLLLVLALSVGTTACTNVSDSSSESTEDVSKESSASQSTEDGKDSQGVGQQVDDVSQEQGNQGNDQSVVSDGQELILFPGYYADVYYGIDSNGNKLSEYRWQDVCEKLKQKGMNFDNAVMSAMGDGVFFVYQYEMIENRYGYKVYAVDAKSLEVVSLWTSSEGWWLNSIDFYQGKVYITSASDGAVSVEEVYVKDQNSLSFALVQNPNAQFIQSLQGFDLRLSSVNLGNRYGCCSITRVLDEAGYVIGSLDDQYYKFTKDGMVSVLPGMSGYAYIQGYDEDGVVYSKFDNDTSTNNLYGVNLKTGENLLIAMGANDSTKELLAYADGKAYYCVSKENPVILRTNTVYQFDFNSGNSRELYQKDTIPGATDVQPGTQSFQLVNGKIYFVTLQGTELHWVKVDPDASSISFQDQNLVVGEKNVFKYGSIINDTYVGRCKYCGIPLEEYYGEEFVLDEKYSPVASKINQTLADGLQSRIQSYYEQEVEGTDEDCEDHKENPIIWCTSIEKEVNKVEILWDQYLTIEYSGYWYAGGAHGMPSDYQRLFDLTTGEELTLKDIYQGSEKSFKKLVAEKTKEDFLSYEEGSTPYFAEDADEVYEDAYEYAGLTSLNILFHETGISVLYDPYEMGPYASGFIEVSISYEELLGQSRF